MMNTQNGASTDELRDQIATLREDFKKMSGEATQDAKDGLQAAGRQAARTGREAREGVVDAVTSNPLTALALAAGVGYLLGALTRR